MKNRPNPFLRSAALAASIVIAFGITQQHANAASGIWGADADGAWATTGSWSGGTVAGAASSASNSDTATFDGAGNYAVGLGGGSTPRSIGTINITNTGDTTFNNGGFLYLYNALTMDAAAGAVNLGVSFRFNGATANTVTNNSATKLLTISGGVSRTVTGAGVVTIGGAGDTTISGAIAQGTGATLAFVKTGAGVLTLSGNNSFSNGVTLKEGTLKINTNNSALGTGTLQIGDSTGTTAVTLDSLSARSITNALNLYQDFTYTGTNTLAQGTGAITLSTNGTTGNRNINVAASTLTLGGNIGDGGNGYGITKSGAGTLTLSGANTYSGITTINSGTLAISLAASETNGATSSVLGAIPGSATPGKLVFNGGTLSITPGDNISMASNRGILVNAGGGTLKNTAAKTITTSAIIAGDGAMNFDVVASGGWTLGGLNTFSGGATLSGAGTFFVANNSAFGEGTLTLNGAQMRSSTNNDYTLANAVSIAANTTFTSVASEKSLTFAGPAVITGGNRTLTANVGTNVAGKAVVFSGGISEDIAGRSLTMAGSGTLKLSGASTYSGGTILTSGTTQVGVNSVGTVGSITSSAIGTGTLTFNGGTLSSDSTTARTILNPVTFTGNGTLGDATNNGKLTFEAGLNLGAASRTLTVNSDVQLNAAFSNPPTTAATTGFTKSGAGTLTINASNAGVNFLTSGANPAGFVITAGKVIAANTAAFGNAGQYVTPNGGTVEFATDSSPNAYVLNQNSSASGTVILNRATSGTAITYSMGTALLGRSLSFTVEKGGNVTDTPTLTLAGLSLTAGSTGSATVLNPTTAHISITGAVSSVSNYAKTLQLGGTSAGSSISGNISNGTNVVTLDKANASVWTLSGNNDYTGTTTVSAGTLILSGTNTGAGATSVVGGTLQAGASGAFNPNSAVTMTNAAAAVLDLSGYNNSIGSLAGGGATGGNVTLGAGTLTTGGDNTSTAYAGGITGNGGLTKAGTGVFTLSAAQGYTGATQVDAGSLIVNSTLASSGVTVGNNATLGGTGTIANGVIVNSGGTLSAATATTAGTLTLGSLALDSGSNLAYEFGGTSDLISVTTSGGLTINGGALSLYTTGGVSPLTTNGTYDLFGYTGALGGAMSNLSVSNSQAGKTYALNDTGSLIQIILGTATISDWNNGSNTGLWTDSGNWSGSVPNALGAVANFNIAGSSVDVNGAKTVGSIIFDNATGYTITGGDTITLDNGIAAGVISITSGNHAINAPIALSSQANINPASGTTLTLGGAISGSKAATYSGAGTTILTGSNSYSGTTTISAGTLQIGSGGTTGSLSASSAIVNNAALVFNRSNTLTQGTDFASVISGTGTINQSGGGTTVLNGANTYSGTTTISAGALNIQNNTALGTTVGATSVTAGAALQVQGGLTAVAENLTLNGTGISNDGALRSISGANILSGTVALGSTGVRINSDTAATALTLSNAAGVTGTGFNLTVGGVGDTVISGGVKTGASATLTKDGSGTLTLGGASTYTGATTVTEGTLVLQGGVGYASSGFAIASGAVLELNTDTSTGYSSTTFSGAGTLRKSGTGQAFWGSAVGTFALTSGSLIDVQGGTLTGGSNANENWSGNMSDLNIGSLGTFETVEANVRVDAVTGSGNLLTGYSGSGYTALTIGVDNGSGTFTGILSSGHNTGNVVKTGTGTQTFTGSGGVFNGSLTLTDGVYSIDTVANGGIATTITTTANSNTATVASAAGLEVGMAVWAGNNTRRTPIGTTITAISGTTITLSNSTGVVAGTNVAAAIGFGNGLGIGTNAAARLVFNGGTLQYTGATAGTDRNFTINAGKIATIDITNAATNLTISGASTATSGALTKIGAGTLTLTNANTYSGDTTISQGTLALGSGGSIGNSSTIHIANNATFDVSAVSGFTIGSLQTLAGAGTVKGNVTVAGTLGIGSSPGTMSFDGDLTLGGITDFEFGSALFTSGSYDLAQSATGSVTFGGILNLYFNSGETYADNSSVQIFDFDGGYSGSFTTVNFSGLAIGQSATFNPTTGFVTVIPEPRAALLGGLGLLMLLRRRR